MFKRCLRKLIDDSPNLVDWLLAPFVYPAARVLKRVRKLGVYRMPRCKKMLLNVGVFPIRDHFYEPQFNFQQAHEILAKERKLPGIDLDIQGQLKFLKAFCFEEEIKKIPKEKRRELEYYFDNAAFGPGDGEYWYQLIRLKKPKRIIEIGSGNSTLMAINAIRQNQTDDPDYECQHVCIEPFKMPWLEQTGVSVVRKKVEDTEASFFADLVENDILFIDSSHMIRPHGDVLFEYLELLPTLNKGVIVHVHDIFTPRNYPQDWLTEHVRFWNEQYLLEAFLSHNSDWKVVGSLNHLYHQYKAELKAACPNVSANHEPGSFYLQKVC